MGGDEMAEIKSEYDKLMESLSGSAHGSPYVDCDFGDSLRIDGTFTVTDLKKIIEYKEKKLKDFCLQDYLAAFGINVCIKCGSGVPSITITLPGDGVTIKNESDCGVDTIKIKRSVSLSEGWQHVSGQP
jgi:hypothetical protein